MSLSSTLIGLPLRWEALRKRLRFALRQRYFAEEDTSVPLGHGCSAPILHQDYWHSFEEIFFMGEYDGAGQRFPLPTRWLDLGCHAGFFSLCMLLQHRKRGNQENLQALLVDGDGRVGPQIRRVAERNNAVGRIRFEHAAISRGAGPLRFIERECMASGPGNNPASASEGVVREVPVISPARILELLPPPYDLIKVDIEGGEHDLLTGYQEVLMHADHMLFEWHSWHGGGGGLPQLRKLAADLGFTRQQEFKTPHQAPAQGTDAECGVLLLQREPR